MATRTRDQAPFLAEGVVLDQLTALDYSCEGRWNTTEWWRSYFGDEVEEMAYGRMYLDIDGSVYPYTVELGSRQDFAGLIWLKIGPNGIETVRQIAANTQPPDHAAYYPQWREQVEELARDYERAWASGDSEALAGLYEPGATVTDNLAGIQVAGIDAILPLASASSHRMTRDLAVVHHPDMAVYLDQAPADYGYSPGWAAFGGVPLTEVWLLTHSTDSCPGESAIALAVDIHGQITAERWLHTPGAIRECFDTQALPQGWWTDLDLPTPLAERVTGTLDTSGQAIEIRNGSLELNDLLKTALDRFEDAGLAEPVVSTVAFDPYDPRCDDFQGYADWSDEDTDILVCVDSDGTAWRNLSHDADVAGRFTASDLILHELGHAWLAGHLTEPARAAFTDHVGVSTWNDKAQPPVQRGVEWAAETLSWGLGGALQTEFAFTSPPCDALVDGFRILTGSKPLTTCTDP